MTPWRMTLAGLGMTATRTTLLEKREVVTLLSRLIRGAIGPNPVPSQTNQWGSPRRPRVQPDSSDSGGSRQTPRFEREHINELKRNHYASHCQMCLCERLPRELAPVGSYIESEEVRRKVVVAHHADLVAAGGAQHAGNLILLCDLHHNNYGGQLTRTGITAALRDNAKEMSICFGEDSHVNGLQIEVTISGTEEIVKLFFTDHHRRVLVVTGNNTRLIREVYRSVSGSQPVDDPRILQNGAFL